MAEDYIEFNHTDTSITTLEGFMEENSVLNTDAIQKEQFFDPINKFGEVEFTPEDLLAYSDNAMNMTYSYSREDLEKTGGKADVNILRTPTIIRVPKDKISKEGATSAGNILVPTSSVKAFLEDRVREIYSDPDFKPSIDPIKGKSDTFIINTNFSVWMFCKALGETEESGKLLNITHFVQSITTNVGKTGGNFSLRLSPLVGEFLKKGGEPEPASVRGLPISGSISAYFKKIIGRWSIKRDSAVEYMFDKKNFSRNIVQRESIQKRVNKDEFVRNNFFFHNVIGVNDVVFVRFEKLEIERDRQKDEQPKTIMDNLELPFNELPGKVYDMIGLVDTNTISYNAAGSDVSIDISGRDLMKVLIEDGQYFYPTDFATNPSNVTNVSGNRPLQRLITGELSFFDIHLDSPIEKRLKQIFNLLSNVEIVDERLFSFYPDSDRTKRYEYQSDKEGLKKVDVAGIWQIIKLIVDPEVHKRRVVDSSIATQSGSLLSFVQKICQEPFVEFYGDTYLDKYFFFARKPPLDEKGFLSNIIIDVESNSVYNDSLSFDDSEVYSWYRLIPNGNWYGDTNITLAAFPMLFFERFAKLWGSRPYEITSNYVNYNGYPGQTLNQDFLEKQATQDLGWLIETHALLPFTRKGTITIKGDRRIKVGMNIRHKETGELFYVESVSQSATVSDNSVDRTTTLTVCRGIVEKYAKQYFRIVDLGKNSLGECGDRSLFQVNNTNFDFFLKRKQFQ